MSEKSADPRAVPETGPCGTPLTPEGIARFAWATFDPANGFDAAAVDWRFGHLKQLIAHVVEAAVKEAGEACARVFIDAYLCRDHRYAGPRGVAGCCGCATVSQVADAIRARGSR